MKIKRDCTIAVFTCTFGILLTLAFMSCDTRYNNASLEINEIIDPNSLNPLVYIALSRNHDFIDGFKSYSSSYDMGNPVSPAIVFDSIVWERQDKKGLGEFWLFVAQDMDSSSTLSDGDRMLPAMRLILANGERTIIDRLVFDTSLSPSKLITTDFAANKYEIRLFIEEPTQISPTKQLFLRLGTGVLGGLDLCQGDANHSHDIPIESPSLASGFSFHLSGAPESYAILWLDLDDSGTLNNGDWISTADETSVPELAPSNRWILWSDQVVTP